MFDLSLTHQVPTSTLSNPTWREAAKQLAAIISNAFQLEESGNLPNAIKAHIIAKDLVDSIAKVKGIRKFNRKMYERQAEIHQERIAHLEKVQREGGTASLIPKRSSLTKTSESLGILATNGPLSQSGTGGVQEYALTHTSDLVDVGVRSYWFFLHNISHPELTAYAVQGISDMDRPMIETLLRRPDEFFPLGGHLHTNILAQPEKRFKLRMRRRGEEEDKAVWEVPTKETKKKEWGPRTLQFGERWFVWKNEESGGLMKKFGFEILWETRGEGGDVVGERLFWGKVGGGGFGGKKFSLFVNEVMGLELREHCFASQVSRLMRWTYPPQKDLEGLEKGAAAVTAVGALLSLGQLLG